MSDLTLLFDRPFDPLFVKRSDGKVAFEIPQEYYTDRYKGISSSLETRFGEDVERTVKLPPLTNPPNLAFANALGIEKPFSLFILKHRKIAGLLTEIFIKVDRSLLLATAAYAKDRVNPEMFQVSFDALQ